MLPSFDRPELTEEIDIKELLQQISELIERLITADEALADDQVGPVRRRSIQQSLHAVIDFIEKLPFGGDLAMSRPITELALGLAQLDAGSRPALFDPIVKTGAPGNLPIQQVRDIATAGFLEILRRHGLGPKAAAEELASAYGKGGMYSRNRHGEIINVPTKRLKIWANRAETHNVKSFVSNRANLASAAMTLDAIADWSRLWVKSARKTEIA